MLGAAHSCANPLTAYFGVVHGDAVGVMLPHVIRFNNADAEVRAIYANLYTGDLARRVTELLAMANMPQTTTQHGVSEADTQRLSELALKQWTAQFNPRPLSLEDFQQLYRAAL
jgi:alcohol dehydrogenase